MTPLDGATSGADKLHALPQIPDHELIRCIGRGGYGEVWLARNIMGTYRAVKIVYRRTFKDAHPFEREFNGISVRHVPRVITNNNTFCKERISQQK